MQLALDVETGAREPSQEHGETDEGGATRAEHEQVDGPE
jgi:hypothetical protein